jgi:4-amino-4-deoxy-L-arabinose transferase-like glycosyltransferase
MSAMASMGQLAVSWRSPAAVWRAAWFADAVVVVAIGVYCALMVPTLTRFPPLINDEGREANMFWVASGADPTAERMNAHRGFSTWGTGGLQGATTAVIFRLGGVGVFQARLTSLLWGALLLVGVYWLGKTYWNRIAGTVAVVVLAVSDPFLVSTHTLRPDIQVATLAVLALLCAERGVRAGVGWLSVLGGLLIGLSVDTHLNSLGFIPLVGLVYPLRHGVWFVRRRDVWLFGLGLGLAAAYYAAVRILPDPAGYLAGMGYWVGVDKKPPGVGLGLLGAVSNELDRYWDYFGEEPWELALVAVALVAGAVWAARGDAGSRLLVVGLAVVAVFFIVAVSMKSKYYMLLTYPMYALLIGRGVERLGALGRRLGGSAGVGLAGAIVVVLTAFIVWLPMRGQERAWDKYINGRRYREGQEYMLLTTRLSQMAGPGAKVLAPPVYWIGMKDHPFVDIYVYERLYRQMRMTPAEFLAEVRPDFVITDAKIAQEKPVEKILYNELDARATREFVVRHKNYGDVAVYRLRW